MLGLSVRPYPANAQEHREPEDPIHLIEQGVMPCDSGDEEGARQAFAQAIVISSTYL